MQPIRHITRIVLILLVAITAYATISVWLPVPRWAGLTTLNTITGLCLALLHGAQMLGWRRLLALFGIVVVTGLLMESLGVATGWVYGPYHYTEKLGVKFLGLVPYLIAIAWFMMIYPSFLMGQILLSRWHPQRWVKFFGLASLSGLIMTAWDLAMDPLMVSSGNWVWDKTGLYFGIPIQNFWGWWLTVFIAICLFLWFTSAAEVNPDPPVPWSWAVYSYICFGLSTIIVDGAIGLGGAALVGTFAMLPWVILTLLRLNEVRREYARESRPVAIAEQKNI
jgi:uncharacterized membrane protein